MQENLDLTLEEDVAALEALLVQVGWLSRRRLEQELNGYNLTVPQYIALRCISEREQGCSMTELAESSQQVPATMTGVIDRLAERQLVSRERDLHDRRTQRVEITAAGRTLLDQVSARKRDWIRQFLGSLPIEERKAIILLGKRYLTEIERTTDTR